MRSEIKRIGDSYFVVFKEAQVTLEFSRIAEHRDTITAEVSFVHLTEGTAGLYRVNLVSASGRTSAIKSLETSMPGVPWRTALDQGCQDVIRALRTPEPWTDLATMPVSANGWLIERWVPMHETTVLFGDGGAGKSYIALGLALAGLQGHKLGSWSVGPLSSVLYLDWESSPETHAQRLRALTAHRESLPPECLRHRRMVRPLTDVIDGIRADVDRYRSDLVICDSLAPASGPEPETGDAAIRTMNALASLPTTRLVTGHVSKASAELRQARPYGSVYVQNLARSTIEARRPDDDDEDDGFLTVSLFQRKRNFSGRAKPIGLRFCFEGEADHQLITVLGADPDMSHGSKTTEILDALRSGARTVTDITEVTAIKADLIRALLHKALKRNLVVKMDTVSGGRGKKSQWGLVDRNRNQVPF